MARFRRNLSPIISIKHFIARTALNIASGILVSQNLVNAVAQNAVVNVEDVVEGSLVKAIWIESWYQNTDVTNSTTTFIMTVEKVPSGQLPMTFAQSLALQAYPNKKNILYTTQGIIGARRDGNGQLPIFRQWIKIPKGKQRIGLGDKIVLNHSSLGASAQICGMSIYKEYK